MKQFDLLDADMFKVYSDMLRSDCLRIQQGKSAKFGYLPMMAVATLQLRKKKVILKCSRTNPFALALSLNQRNKNTK
jgi:hypothetical protein